MVSAGIFGPKLSGKTTLAKTLSAQYWSKHKVRSIVLDINGDTWGEHAFVMDDEDKFWKVVWETTNSIVIVDEAAATIRRDRELVPVFTRLRHNRHVLIVIGHSGMDLLPAMRQQFDTVYLFRQPESAAKVWAETMTEKGLLQAVELKQYEFIRHELYQSPQKMKLKL